FHGAFTGGFSAGYYNTVGTKEGWTPQEFKSSRDQRAVKFQQRAEDLMDEEDLGEFGIGARRIRTAEDFGSGRSAEKRMAWEHDVTSSSSTSYGDATGEHHKTRERFDRKTNASINGLARGTRCRIDDGEVEKEM
ncbi:hypothetical protein OSTOST_22462, partial [Ostertagia ostertagi]